MIDEYREAEKEITFSTGEIKEIKKLIESYHIKEAHLKLLKGKGDKIWKESFAKHDPQYYRKECDLASNYYKKGDNNPIMVILRDDITNDNDFEGYYGTDRSGFLNMVANGDFLVLAMKPEKYEKNTYLMQFFEQWKNNKDTKDIYPIYANRLETVLVKDKGFHSWKGYKWDLQSKYKTKFKKLIGKDPGYAGNLKLRGDAFEYFIERIAWFRLLDAKKIISKIEELLENYIETGDPTIFEEAKLFTFSMFEILGAFTFYCKGTFQNFSVNDLSRIYNSIVALKEGEIMGDEEEKIKKSVFPLKFPVSKKGRRLNADVIKDEKEIYRVSREKGEIDFSETEKKYKEIYGDVRAKNFSKIETRISELEEALVGLSSEFERKFSQNYAIANIGSSVIIALISIPVAPYIGIPLTIVQGLAGYKVGEYIKSKKYVDVTIPSHIWQMGVTDSEFKERIIRSRMFIR